MRMKDLSLRSRLVSGGTLIVLIPLIIVGTVTFINSTHTLEEITKGQTMQIAMSLSGMVQIAIEKDMNILAVMAGDPFIINGAAAKDFGSFDGKLAALYKMVGADYEGLAVFDQEGILRSDGVDKKRVGISIAERNYYQAAKTGKAGVGPIVASKATGGPIFGLSAPIMSKDGRFLGGVLAIVKADFLVRYISSLKLGKTGYAFMFDQKGIVIAHPSMEYIMKMDGTREEGMEELTAKMIRLETGTEEYTYKGIQKVAGFTPVAMTGWSIGVTQEKEEIMTLAYTNRNLILMVSCLFLIMTILAVFFFSGTIINPVEKMLTTLNQAIEQATEAISIIGLDRKVQFVNPAMAAIMDRTIPELVGKEPYLENTNKISIKEIWEVLEHGKIWNGRVAGAKKDSSNFSMNLTVTPVRDAAGNISSFLAIGRDITRELMMESQLRQSQKMEAIGTLAGGIAHDFNNILSAIFGYAELTIHSLKDQAKSADYLKEILKAAGRARDLVNHIMTFSRHADQRKNSIKPKPVIIETLKLLRASLPATIEIVEAVKSEASILADPTQIHQVIMNLSTNAGYAMREHGGTLEVTLDDIDADQAAALQFQGIKPYKYLLLKVSDTGCGIPPEDIDRIFDPFFTTKPPGEGTGLGLSVIHGIVKALDGIITVSSKSGKGTTFNIYLPVSSEESRDSDGKTEEDAPGGSERLLLVDDEEAIIQSGREMLEYLGYKVSAFTKSADALRQFANDPLAFDAVITDYTMPQMTGYELAKKIREIRKDMPLILCSGYMDKEVELKIQNSGINEFIKKPFTRHDFAVALRRVFNNSAA